MLPKQVHKQSYPRTTTRTYDCHQKQTFLATIHKHPVLFSTSQGLTYELINKHLPLSTAALKGHMVQNRRGIRATSSDVQQVIDARKCVSDMSPAKQICSAEEDEIYCFPVNGDRNENTIYSDLTAITL